MTNIMVHISGQDIASAIATVPRNDVGNYLSLYLMAAWGLPGSSKAATRLRFG